MACSRSGRRNKIPGFTEALIELLPTLEDHACSLGRRGGFISRLREGTWLGHVAEHVAIELQSLAGTEVRIGKTRGAGVEGQYNVVYEYREEDVGLEAGRIAVALVNHLVAPVEAPLDFADALERLILLAERQAFGPSTQALVDEAVSRDIPFIRLDRHSLVQLGQGLHQQRIRATMTSRTGAIGVDIASNKGLTNSLLSSAGLPVPRSEEVRTVDDAVAAANKIGYPVVVKPLDGNHGRGVSLDLRSEDEVREAFQPAWDESRNGDVVVESYVTGNDYRVLIIGGKMAAVAERVPASVVGDGKHTVRELVDRENADPRRGIGHERVLTRIRLTAAADELLGQAGSHARLEAREGHTSQARLDRQHVHRRHGHRPHTRGASRQRRDRRDRRPDRGPGRGRHRLHRARHQHPGARAGRRHRRGQRRARLPDAHPSHPGRAAVRGQTGDRPALRPTVSNARIPIISVTGTNGKTTTVRMIGHILKLMGRRVGMTTTDGIVVDGRLIRKGDMSGPRSAQMVLQNPSVDTAVFEVARGGILREGLGYDRNDVAVVTNVTGDHLGLRGVETLSQLAHVKSVIVEAVPRSGTAVLNADDPHVARMGRQSRGAVVYFSMAESGSDAADRLTGHTGRGGAAMVLQQTDDGELIVLRHADRTMPLLYTHLIPATFGGRARMNVANALAAAGAAWAAGAHLHDIRQGLRTFSTSFFQAPGRLNEIEVDGYKVILDYCHNVDGMRRLTEFVDLMMRPTNGAEAGDGDGQRRRARAIGVIGMPGDRRDDDHREYGRLAGHAFDVVIVREDKNLRGRKSGEGAEMVLAGLQQAQAEGGRCKDARIVLDEIGSAVAGLQAAGQGDLVMLCMDDIAGAYRRVMEEAKIAQRRRRSDRRSRRVRRRRGLVELDNLHGAVTGVSNPQLAVRR